MLSQASQRAPVSVRRAIFVYEAARLAAIAAGTPVVPVPHEDCEQDFKDQFISMIVQQCGPLRETSPEALHRIWMARYIENGWTYGEVYDRGKRIHPDLVPYDMLGQLERDKDEVFAALCEIARQWIRE